MTSYQVENFQKYRERKGGNGIRRDQMKAEKTRKGVRELRKKHKGQTTKRRKRVNKREGKKRNSVEQIETVAMRGARVM